MLGFIATNNRIRWTFRELDLTQYEKRRICNCVVTVICHSYVQRIQVRIITEKNTSLT